MSPGQQGQRRRERECENSNGGSSSSSRLFDVMLKIAALSMPLWIIIATAVIRHEVRLGIVESNHFTLTDAVQIKDMISERKHASMQLKAQIEELDRIARDNAARVRAMEGYLMRLSQQTEIEVPVPYRPKAG